ncbi:MAG: protein YgfX [Gammaproteobacteria bacterium]
MWSPGSAAPLRIEPRFSLRLALLLVLSHGGAVAVLWPLAWPWWLHLSAALGVASSFLANWRRHVLRHGRRAVRAAVWLSDGRWRLETSGGVLEDVALAPGCYAHPALVVLHFSGEGRGYGLVLFADGLAPGVHRRLRIRLRGL